MANPIADQSAEFPAPAGLAANYLDSVAPALTRGLALHGPAEQAELPEEAALLVDGGAPVRALPAGPVVAHRPRVAAALALEQGSRGKSPVAVTAEIGAARSPACWARHIGAARKNLPALAGQPAARAGPGSESAADCT